MKVLVMGGTQFNGLALVRELVRTGHDVTTLNRGKTAAELHHWNRSVFFSIDRLREDTGWAPECCFRGTAEQTWEWMRREGRDRALEFDFALEDHLLARIGAA
jgi:nucleoside-diphosphate-sugar epimerase